MATPISILTGMGLTRRNRLYSPNMTYRLKLKFSEGAYGRFICAAINYKQRCLSICLTKWYACNACEKCFRLISQNGKVAAKQNFHVSYDALKKDAETIIHFNGVGK